MSILTNNIFQQTRASISLISNRTFKNNQFLNSVISFSSDETDTFLRFKDNKVNDTALNIDLHAFASSGDVFNNGRYTWNTLGCFIDEAQFNGIAIININTEDVSIGESIFNNRTFDISGQNIFCTTSKIPSGILSWSATETMKITSCVFNNLSNTILSNDIYATGNIINSGTLGIQSDSAYISGVTFNNNLMNYSCDDGSIYDCAVNNCAQNFDGSGMQMSEVTFNNTTIDYSCDIGNINDCIFNIGTQNIGGLDIEISGGAFNNVVTNYSCNTGILKNLTIDNSTGILTANSIEINQITCENSTCSYNFDNNFAIKSGIYTNDIINIEANNAQLLSSTFTSNSGSMTVTGPCTIQSITGVSNYDRYIFSGITTIYDSDFTDSEMVLELSHSLSEMNNTNFTNCDIKLKSADDTIFDNFILDQGTHNWTINSNNTITQCVFSGLDLLSVTHNDQGQIDNSYFDSCDFNINTKSDLINCSFTNCGSGKLLLDNTGILFSQNIFDSSTLYLTSNFSNILSGCIFKNTDTDVAANECDLNFTNCNFQGGEHEWPLPASNIYDSIFTNCSFSGTTVNINNLAHPGLEFVDCSFPGNSNSFSVDGYISINTSYSTPSITGYAWVIISGSTISNNIEIDDTIEMTSSINNNAINATSLIMRDSLNESGTINVAFLNTDSINGFIVDQFTLDPIEGYYSLELAAGLPQSGLAEIPGRIYNGNIGDNIIYKWDSSLEIWNSGLATDYFPTGISSFYWDQIQTGKVIFTELCTFVSGV